MKPYRAFNALVSGSPEAITQQREREAGLSKMIDELRGMEFVELLSTAIDAVTALVALEERAIEAEANLLDYEKRAAMITGLRVKAGSAKGGKAAKESNPGQRGKIEAALKQDAGNERTKASRVAKKIGVTATYVRQVSRGLK